MQRLVVACLRHPLVVASLLIVVVLVACDDAESPASGAPSGAASADVAPAPDTFDGASSASDAAGADGADASETAPHPDASDAAQPATCDEAAWSAAQIADWMKPNVPVGSWPAPDPTNGCLPEEFDTSCQTVCDCKIVVIGCHPRAASVAVPWKAAHESDPDRTGVCIQSICGGTEAPRPGSTLTCDGGECTLTEPHSEP